MKAIKKIKKTFKKCKKKFPVLIAESVAVKWQVSKCKLSC